MTKLIYFLLIFLFLKIVYNLYYFLLARNYFLKYENYLKTPQDWYIDEHKQEIIKIFERANIKDNHIAHTEYAGYGHVAAAPISIFDNLSSRDTNVMRSVYSKIREAKVIFKGRIFESLNPIYWIEIIVYFPTNLLKYFFDMNTSTFMIKFLQTIWFVLVFISVMVGIFFNKEFMSWLDSITL